MQNFKFWLFGTFLKMVDAWKKRMYIRKCYTHYGNDTYNYILQNSYNLLGYLKKKAEIVN